MGSDPYRAILWGLLVLGAAVRIILAFVTYGVGFDIDSLRIAGDAVASHGFHLYGFLQDHDDLNRWPYPGGFLPIILACRAIADTTPFPFHGVIQLPSILADLGLAWAVQYWLASRGRSAAECLSAVTLVALGPSFILISGYHGQINSVTILPAVIAVIVWMNKGDRRALSAGLLLGLGAAVKTVPLFMVFAMLPTCRSRREAVCLVSAAAAVPIVSVLPFLLVEPHSTAEALRSNHGVPGFGGIGLFLQPDLMDRWLHGEDPTLSAVSQALLDAQNLLVGISVLCAGAFAFWRRVNAIDAAALIWLTVFVVNPEWGFEYVVWGLPFFLMARRYLEVLILQIVLIAPEVILYFHFVHFGAVPLAWTYLPTMFVVWLTLLITLIVWIRRLRRGLRIGPDWPWFAQIERASS